MTDRAPAVLPIHDLPIDASMVAEQPQPLIRLVEWYQQMTEGRLSRCRFTPSCSSYASEALTTHGTGHGLWLTVRRLLRCRPFGPSGYDPVPEPDHHRRHHRVELARHHHGQATTTRRTTKDR